MLENLFRGKRIDNNEWVFGNLIICKNGNDVLYVIQEQTESLVHDPDVERCNSLEEFIGTLRIDFKRYFVAPETVGQFTRKCDENGKKVFDGDVLKLNIASLPPDQLGYVQYSADDAAFIVYRISKSAPECISLGYYTYGRFTVVGNVHDNPEFVEEETK